MSDASSIALSTEDANALQDTEAVSKDKPSAKSVAFSDWMSRIKSVPNFQLWALLAAALAVTLILALAIWPSSDNYRTLYFGLSDKDTSAIAEQLQKAGIEYEINQVTGNLRVNETQLYDARLKIASAGLPRGTGRGLEFLDESPEIGRSQFAEQARYHHALEREIARSITSIGDIEKARVHLAIPKKTVFIRERHQPSASVVVFLYPGRSLGQGQVMAIQHLVSSSVPDMQNEKISVIDQRGQLLSTSINQPGMKAGFEHIQYTSELEARYIRRIEELLAPVVGLGKVQAQVTAEVDFSKHESSSERFVPNPNSVRSEQLTFESQASSARGVPGATSNEPPSPAQFTEDNTLRNGSTKPGGKPTRERKVRNYELDRIVSHEQGPTAILKRLSIAVVLGKAATSPAVSPTQDDEQETTPSPAADTATAFTDKELEQLSVLIKNAVGFDAARGDSINLMNAQFSEPMSEPSSDWWEKNSSLDLLEYALVAIMFLILMIVIILPIFRSARIKPPALPESSLGETGLLNDDSEPDIGKALASDQIINGMDVDKALSTIESNEIIANLLPEGFGESGDYDSYVHAAQTIARENPRRAAEVLKGWIMDNV